MKTNLLFTQFVLSAILSGIGAEYGNPVALGFGLALMVLTIIVALCIFEPEKNN